MNINELTLSQVKELVAAFSAPTTPSPTPSRRLAADGQTVIVVLQSGWVAIGRYSQDGLVGSLDDTRIIRRWGTSAGLGELAEKGPLENTKLDPAPRINFDITKVVFVMNVNPAAW